MGMFDKKGKKQVKTTRKPLKVDKMDSMKHLSPEMQQRMRDLEEQGMEKEELEETARKFLADSIGKGGDSGESAEELARQAQEDLERQRLEEEAAAAEAKRQREIAEAKAAAEAAAAARLAAAAREKAQDDVIVAIFNRLDVDKSGGVSIAELVKAMRRDDTLAYTLGLADRHLSQTDGTMDKIAALFYKFDDDQGGELSATEFAKLIKSTPRVIVPHSMQAEARAANFEGEIADTFDVKAFAKDIMKRAVKRASKESDEGSDSGSDASSDDSSEDDSSSSAGASPPGGRVLARLEDAAAVGALAARGEKDAIESIFAFLDKDDSGTVTVREMIIGVRKEPALARTLGLGEQRGLQAGQDQPGHPQLCVACGAHGHRAGCLGLDVGLRGVRQGRSARDGADLGGRSRPAVVGAVEFRPAASVGPGRCRSSAGWVAGVESQPWHS